MSSSLKYKFDLATKRLVLVTTPPSNNTLIEGSTNLSFSSSDISEENEPADAWQNTQLRTEGQSGRVDHKAKKKKIFDRLKFQKHKEEEQYTHSPSRLSERGSNVTFGEFCQATSPSI